MRLACRTSILLAALAVPAAAENKLPHLTKAVASASPWNVVSAGIAAYEVTVDATGAVAGARIVQDVAPYGAILGDDVRTWKFAPAEVGGRAAASHVLVLGFFGPPLNQMATPTNPKYKTTVAPDAIPWPTSVLVPPYPPNALGGAKVILEADVSEAGKVTDVRVLTETTGFDSAAADTVRSWTFRPARQGHRDVPSRAFIVVSFVGEGP